jgi:site-specific DNA-methyltransferase (adenine-specific)
MKDIPDNSINLVVMDPPYNIGKDHWDKVENYVGWMGRVFTELERVLKDTGSMYFFHNDFLQICDLQQWLNRHSGFIFKQLIVWNKKYEGVYNEGFLQGYNELSNLRNYQRFAEYCMYYTFQDVSGLTAVKHDVSNFQTLRKYFYDMLCYMGETNKGIAKKLGHRKAEHAFYVLPKKAVIDAVGQKADHCFRYGSTQWDLPTEETYNELIEVFKIDAWDGFKEYEELREEYDGLRYTFNNQKTHHSVWNYPIAKKEGHLTPKPVELIKNIIFHSSNEGDLVLDPFLGSGTTLLACKQTNRNCIGFEKQPEYEQLIRKKAMLDTRDIFQYCK